MDTEREQLTTEQRLVVQAVYDHFREHGAWPKFITIDRPLRRSHQLDSRSVIQSLPDSFIVKPRPATWFNADDEVHLRLSGIEACQGGSEDTDRFVRLLRWLAQQEVDFEPAPDATDPRPQVTDEEVREQLGLGQEDGRALQRVFAMLQLDNWGTGGWAGGPGGWTVYLSPDIWRFRDVQTVADCLRARLQWQLEAEAAVPRVTSAATPPEYFHVRLSTKSSRAHDEVKLDLTKDELESRFLAPYREGRPFVMNGKTIPIDDLAALRISRTDQSSEQLRLVVKADQRAMSFVAPIPENWRIAAKGDDVTDEFIIEPPGGAVPLTAVAPGIQSVSPAPAPASSSEPATYIDRQITDSIRAKAETSSFNTSKLLSLIDELNDNYAKKNTYAAHALLRAILDHVPPILSCVNFEAVANNYSWSKAKASVDKNYMKQLLDCKNQAHDALHRQISPKPCVLRFDDLPRSVCINRLLQECADNL